MALTRDGVFDRILVDHLVLGGTRVSWSLYYQFADPGPYSFQLQVGQTGYNTADDWTNVGPPLDNAFTTTDPNRYLRGVEPTTHYRVVLSTLAGTYTSQPVSVYSLLPKHDWLAAREIIRKEQLRYRLWASCDGYLLKRRHAGPQQTTLKARDPRTMVVDPILGTVVRRDQTETYGTPYLGGYFAPEFCQVDFNPNQANPSADPQRGNVDDTAIITSGRMLLLPPVAKHDVFVDDSADLRYEIHGIEVTGALRNIGLIGTVELRQLPFGDVLYQLPVPD